MNQTVIFEKMKAGQVTAFIQFYEINKSEKYRRDYGILRDTGYAEDAVGDTFVNLWRKREDILNKVKNYGEVCAFITRMNKNRCLEMIRKDKRLELMKNPFDDIACNHLPKSSESPPPDPVDQVAVRSCINRLNAYPDRAAIICRYYWGMSFQEIANHFGYGDTNAAARKAWGDVERAKKSLKLCIEGNTNERI